MIPTRPVPRINDLTADELTSLMESVKTVGSAIEKAYNGDSLTVACQVRRCLLILSKSSGLQLVHYRMAQVQDKLSLTFISISYPAGSRVTSFSPTGTPYTPQ